MFEEFKWKYDWNKFVSWPACLWLLVGWIIPLRLMITYLFILLLSWIIHACVCDLYSEIKWLPLILFLLHISEKTKFDCELIIFDLKVLLLFNLLAKNSCFFSNLLELVYFESINRIYLITDLFQEKVRILNLLLLIDLLFMINERLLLSLTELVVLVNLIAWLLLCYDALLVILEGQLRCKLLYLCLLLLILLDKSIVI